MLRKQSAEIINEVIHNATPEELDYILRKSSASAPVKAAGKILSKINRIAGTKGPNLTMLKFGGVGAGIGAGVGAARGAAAKDDQGNHKGLTGVLQGLGRGAFAGASIGAGIGLGAVGARNMAKGYRSNIRLTAEPENILQMLKHPFTRNPEKAQMLLSGRNKQTLLGASQAALGAGAVGTGLYRYVKGGAE